MRKEKQQMSIQPFKRLSRLERMRREDIEGVEQCSFYLPESLISSNHAKISVRKRSMYHHRENFNKCANSCLTATPLVIDILLRWLQKGCNSLSSSLLILVTTIILLKGSCSCAQDLESSTIESSRLLVNESDVLKRIEATRFSDIFSSRQQLQAGEQFESENRRESDHINDSNRRINIISAYKFVDDDDDGDEENHWSNQSNSFVRSISSDGAGKDLDERQSDPHKRAQRQKKGQGNVHVDVDADVGVLKEASSLSKSMNSYNNFTKFSPEFTPAQRIISKYIGPELSNSSLLRKKRRVELSFSKSRIRRLVKHNTLEALKIVRGSWRRHQEDQFTDTIDKSDINNNNNSINNKSRRSDEGTKKKELIGSGIGEEDKFEEGQMMESVSERRGLLDADKEEKDDSLNMASDSHTTGQTTNRASDSHFDSNSESNRVSRLNYDHELAGVADQISWHHPNSIEPEPEPEPELEDDDLFLTKDSARSSGLQRDSRVDWPAVPSMPQRHRVARLAGNSAPSMSTLQTIYFGGFFPWLTDEEHHVPKSKTPLKAHKKLAGSVRRPNVSTMINANQDREPDLSLTRSEEEEVAASVSAEEEEEGEEEKLQDKSITNNKQEDGEEGEEREREEETDKKPSELNTTPVSLTNRPQNSEGRHQLGRFILPAVRLALDHINNNSSVLSPYKLEIVPRDTQCNATISLKEFFDMVYEAPKKILLYGDACRVSTDPIAKASYFFDLIQISYADTDPIYTIENYPNFFRVVPSENALSLARIPFIRHFNWTRVGTIYQNLPRYSLPHSKLLTDLERFNIVIKQSVSLPGSVDGLQNRDLGDELRKLKEKDVRIILGNFDEEWGLLLFCEAFREKMTGRKYQWILTGMSEDKLWQYYKSKGSQCTEQELLIAMDGYIVTDITPVTRSQQPTVSGMLAHEYSNEYKKRANEMNISFEENKFYGYVYDGIWAIALALHRVDNQLKYYNHLAEAGRVKLVPEMKGLYSLLDFDYHKPIWVKLIRSALNRTKFHGVTGTVSFNKNERPGLISFSQFQAFRDMSEVIIGSYDALRDQLDLKVGFPIFWRGPTPPIDYTIERVTPFRINRTLFVIISILAIFGIILAFIFLTINIKFRNQRYIKMSSPYLNNLIIIGCILTYTSVIILGLDSGLTSEYNFPYICNARAWVLMAGFTLAFGSMFSKTFRVHSIFTNIKLHKKVIKDYKLFMVVFILLTFDVCILIVWQYFDPFYRDTNNGTSIQDLDNEDIIIVPEMEHCQSKRMTIFLSVIYVYKGLLMAFGCFLAWETRHVSIPALNDSKYIGLSVYNVVIMCVIGAGLSFVLRDQQDASFVIISIFIIFCSTTTLCLVFVPKLRMLIELKQNPRAGDHRVRATLKTFKKNYQEEAIGAAGGCRDAHGNMIGRGFGINLNERIKILLEENVKQRSTLKEKTYELEALTYKYRKIQNMIQTGQYFQALQSTTSTNVNLPTVLDPTITTETPTNNITSQVLIPEVGSYTNLNDDKAHTLSPQNHLKLNRSLLMSSTTQLTTTNTTSSTNNATDMTTDCSSPKVVSSSTISALREGGNQVYPSGKINKDLGKFDSSLNISKEQLIVKHENENLTSPTNYTMNMMRGYQDKTNISIKKQQATQLSGIAKQPVRDYSYCSVRNDQDLNGSKSRDGLFTVFSYIFNGQTNQRSRKETRAKYETEAENNFIQWSKGPFCALMVKNNCKNTQIPTRAGSNIPTPGKAVLKESNIAKHMPIPPTSGQPTEDTRSSCPDLIGKFERRQPAIEAKQYENSRVIKYSRKRSEQYLNKGKMPSKKMKLPRTLSMIEYLGLSEFDLIARRHDKLLRRRITRQPICCNQQTSCICCIGNLDSRRRTRSQIYSESDIVSSRDLIRTRSRLSCSTCCSSATRSYNSQSNNHDDSTESSISTSSQTPTSMISYSSNQHLYNTNSQTVSRSSSYAEHIFDTSTHYCRHHQPIDDHRHRLNHHNPHLYDSISSGSSASSSIYLNRTTRPFDGTEHQLCTSGMLIGAAESREDANDAARPAQQLAASTSGADLTNFYSTNDDCSKKDSRHNEESKRKLTIKCDVLESL